jgi:hypothetical protein
MDTHVWVCVDVHVAPHTQACCALFGTPGSDGYHDDKCTNVYAHGEFLRVCPHADAFERGKAQDPGCLTAHHAGGKKVCQGFRSFKGRGDLRKTVARDMAHTAVLEVRVIIVDDVHK